jgi:tetratricopeptide (TPR) repeat protein
VLATDAWSLAIRFWQIRRDESLLTWSSIAVRAPEPIAFEVHGNHQEGVVLSRILFFVLIGVLPLSASDALGAHELLEQGHVDLAVGTLKEQVRTQPNNAEAYNLLCRAYLMADKWDPAVSACEHAVKLEPQNSQYHLWLGRSYGQKAEHVGAFTAAHVAGQVRDQFETAVRLDPKSVDARADLADFYLEAPWVVGGGQDKAAAQADEIQKLEPAQANLLRARMAEKKKDFATAESQIKQAIQDNQGAAGPWMALAHLYRRTGRFDEMERAIDRATAPSLNRPDVLTHAAQLLIETKRSPGVAQNLLQRYLSSPTPSEDAPVFEAHYLLGTLFEQQKQPEQAITQYQAALELAAEYSPARNALERLTNRAGNEGGR